MTNENQTNVRTKQSKFTKGAKWVLIAMGGLMLLAVIQKVTESKGEAPANSESNHVEGEENRMNYTRGRTILDDYKENEFTANKKYKGKNILVYGASSRVQLDPSDDPFITLDSEGFRSTHCEIDKRDGNLNTIKEGNAVWLVCVGAGEVTSSPMLKKCRVTGVEESLGKPLGKATE